MGGELHLQLSERPTVYDYLSDCNYRGLHLLCQRSPREESLCRAAQLYAVAEPQRFRAATRGHGDWANGLLPTRRESGAGAWASFHKLGFVDPKGLFRHGIDSLRIPRGGLQHNQHTAIRTTEAAELYKDVKSGL